MREKLKALIEFFRAIPDDKFGDAVQMERNWPEVKCGVIHLHDHWIKSGVRERVDQDPLWQALQYAQGIGNVSLYLVNDGRTIHQGEACDFMQWGGTAKERVINFLTAILKDCKDGEEDRHDSR